MFFIVILLIFKIVLYPHLMWHSGGQQPIGNAKMPKLISRFAVDVFRFSFELVFIFVFSSANILAQETGPRINEFLALNSTGLTDEDSDFSDWIEIYNPTPAAIDLGGWSLTDDAENPQKWLLPSVTLAANAYLIVFASGKDRALPGQELHVNFRLSGEGEYLALADPAGNRFTEFDPVFPAQQADISFAYFQGDYLQSPTPTPGSENQVSGNHLLPPPDFSVQRGFFEQPFQVEIISGLSNAQIYYTTDGSAPTAINGTEYTAPLQNRFNHLATCHSGESPPILPANQQLIPIFSWMMSSISLTIQQVILLSGDLMQP